MRPCREPKRFGFVKTKARVSEKVTLRLPREPKQIDTAGNRGFSGTQVRQGQEASSRNFGSLLMPRSRCVAGAGPFGRAHEKRNPGRATEDAARRRKEQRAKIDDPDIRPGTGRIPCEPRNEVTFFQRLNVGVTPTVGPVKKDSIMSLMDSSIFLDRNF